MPRLKPLAQRPKLPSQLLEIIPTNKKYGHPQPYGHNHIFGSAPGMIFELWFMKMLYLARLILLDKPSGTMLDPRDCGLALVTLKSPALSVVPFQTPA